MSGLSRRGLVASGAAGMAFGGMARMAQAQSTPAEVEASPYVNEVYGYGPLRTDPFGVFDLPEGFSYTIVNRAGDPMSDGLVTPYKTDGMGCFAGGGDRVVLVRNHELKPPADYDYGPFGVGQVLAGKVDAAHVYDRADDGRYLTGGTTTLVYDLRRRKLESCHLSLTGASTNCAGGMTPWGSWLTCEEIAVSSGVRKSHGWVFEVPSARRGLVEPVPLTALGRFRHEAAAVDPRTGVIYLTEDEYAGGLFYRFLPNDRTAPSKGGRLQALGFKPDQQANDSRNWARADWTQGDVRDVVWIDLEGVDNPDNALAARGAARGAAWFARGEGVYFGDGELYFNCTSGGPAKLGQIMRYRPSPHEGQADENDQPGRIQLFLQPTDKSVLFMGDNLAVSPWGHLVVCEDKVGGVNFLKGVTPQGKVYAIGRQAEPGVTDVKSNSELAGCCFSPDGTTLFVNIYWPGTTLAITGPWSRLRA
ncbi:MAG TPA: alkaline phosphatase PhoX [Caulobacteraceae bacterium]|jgi:secreted PhoX family phosphatase|nr:alkaline phosphatase PhoX [Caulobacteraceae bacterium]